VRKAPIVIQNLHVTFYEWGRDSSVVIATRYGLDGPGIESRYWQHFPAPVYTGPEAQPASYYDGYRVFPGG